MTEITTAMEDIVENADLSRRLKDRVYDAIEDRDDVTIDAVEDITTAVENRYTQTRVDPLDPVGTVSAQSIGEPGTQMSVPADEDVIVRENGATTVTNIGPFVDDLMAEASVRSIGDHEVAIAPDDLETLSLGADEQVHWKAIEEISRHPAPDSLLEITTESGRTVRATESHSFVTRMDNEIVPVAGASLEPGDWLPVVNEFEGNDEQATLDIRPYFDTDAYWFTSSFAADGGSSVAAFPAGDDQVRNKQSSVSSGALDDASVYPVQGTVGLPEQFPLDATTGFFIGAFLAEGNITEYYVSISNVDAAFQDKIRAFATRFGLSTNEYHNESGFSTGYDIRVNGKVLADLLRAMCYRDGEKAVPGFAYGANQEFVAGVLNGYLSGDGNVGTSSVRASSTSEHLIEGIALLLARVGVHCRFGQNNDSMTLRIPKKFVPQFANTVGLTGTKSDELETLATDVSPDGPDPTDQIPGFGDALLDVTREAGIPSREFNSASTRQRIGRSRLERLLDTIDEESDVHRDAVESLERAVESDVVWERIESIDHVDTSYEYVYDFSVAGLETFTTGSGIVTHNTMNTFHYAGVAEIDVTQGLPRLIELVDARKEPDTPMMTVFLDDEHATDREKAHEVVWKIEATRILALGDISTNVADMLVQIDLNDDTLRERWPTVDDVTEIASGIADTIEAKLGVSTVQDDTVIEFGPEQPSYRELLQLVEQLRDIVFKGIDDISRVVIRKEQREETEDEFVLYTEGSAFGKVLDIEGVDPTRTTTNNIHEIYRTLGVEAARESIIEETMNTLEEQGLDDVNIRHLMLVSDIMTHRGTIESIGRHGISGSKESVLARAAFEVTVNHLLDAAVHGEIDDLNGVTENVIVGKPIKLGTGDVDLRMRAADDEVPEQDAESSAD